MDEDFIIIEAQEDAQVTLEHIQIGVMKMGNWTTAGPDQVQGFWFKRMTHLHPRPKYSSSKESNLVTSLTR